MFTKTLCKHFVHKKWTHTKVETVCPFQLSFKKRASYNTINTARSALASIVFLEDKRYTISTHPWISRYFKGVFNLRPPAPRYTFIWDVGKVLEYLRKLTPAHKISLRQLTLKLCTLLALVTAQRVQTICYFTLDNMSVSRESVEIAVTNLLKQSRPGHVGAKISLKALPGDKKLCIVHYLREYIHRTKPLRKNERNLFICYKRPHAKASKQTIARWIKTILKASGINTDLFKAHSTRAAATSLAKRNKLPVAEILKHAGWSSESTFRNFYLRPTLNETSNSFGQAVLGHQLTDQQ